MKYKQHQTKKLVLYNLIYLLYAFAIFCFIGSQDINSVSTVTQSVLNLLNIIFGLMFFLKFTSMMLSVVKSGGEGSGKLSLNEMLYLTFNTLVSITAFYLMYILVYNFNDKILSLFTLSESSSIDYKTLSIILLSFSFFYFYSKIKGYLVLRPNYSYLDDSTLLTANADSTPDFSSKDIESIVVHEVGHAVSLALSLDDVFDIRIHINKRIHPQKPHGKVVYKTGEDKTKKTTLYYNEMICSIAGNVAENKFLSSKIMGSRSDNEMWFKLAEHYLSQMSNGANIFYPRPNSKAQVEHNNVLIQQLKEEQVLKIENLLSNHNNILVFNEIKDLIYNKLEYNTSVVIESKELMPLIRKIIT